MTEPEAAPLIAGLITITASAYATHPEGADLSELPSLDSEPGDDETTETT